MTTTFSSLPIVDLSILSQSDPSSSELETLSNELHNVFASTGFAYLANAPLSFSHDDVFGLASDFFGMPGTDKMKLAKKTFVQQNENTYRGYFPPQSGQMDNLKEGFEVGPASTEGRRASARRKFDLNEPNVWPSEQSFPGGQARLGGLYKELQSLSSSLLSLLAVSLGKEKDFFKYYLDHSVSTLRLLHYPPQQAQVETDKVKLCCTPHTDSGILTLLHQDPTGGLEVLNAGGEWVPAPYIPGSIVVNIGDLLADVSGGRFVATQHRVRTSAGGKNKEDSMGRFSVPFFFEPGEDCIVTGIDGGSGVRYGDHVRGKMSTWVEFQDVPKDKTDTMNTTTLVSVEA